MPAVSLFRFVLIAGLLFPMFGLVAGATLTNTLPPVLQDYLTQLGDAELSDGEGIMWLVVFLMIGVVLPLCIVGLWRFRPWARTLFVVITVASVFLSLAIGPVVMNSWEAMFGHLGTLLDGILLVMMFTGDIGQRFTPAKTEPSS